MDDSDIKGEDDGDDGGEGEGDGDDGGEGQSCKKTI